MPGLGGTTAIALLMPLTFSMEPNHAMALVGGIMGAVSAGGSISAILLNTPGTAPNAATCFDGYPLAQQGKAGLAIGAAATASTLGGLIGVVVLIMVIPVMKAIVLLFGPPEFFMLAMMGLSAIALSTGGQFLRGLIAGAIGLMLSFVGYNAVSGGVRFTLGSEYLWDGIPLVPALTGLFAISEMIALSVSGGTIAKEKAAARVTSVIDGVVAVFTALEDAAARLRHRHRDRRRARPRRHGGRLPLLHRGDADLEAPGDLRQGQYRGRDRPGSRQQRQGRRRADPDAGVRRARLRRNGGVSRRAGAARTRPRTDAADRA